jgi:hypothetical protein
VTAGELPAVDHSRGRPPFSDRANLAFSLVSIQRLMIFLRLANPSVFQNVSRIYTSLTDAIEFTEFKLATISDDSRSQIAAHKRCERVWRTQ